MKIEYNALRQKIYDVWMSKCISGNIGFNLECYKEILHFKCIDDYAPKEMYPNDDLDIQLAWLDLLLERGFDIEAEDLLQKFIDCYHFDFSEYGYAKRNYKRGILPPYSGKYNNYFAECMGCPIRAEVWALVCSGNIERSLELAKIDGMIDHGDESIYAEQWIVAMESLAFCEKDIKTILQKALSYIPKSSRVGLVVQEVIEKFSQGIEWLPLMRYIHNNYSSPDGTYVVINMAILSAGLLYGDGDFDKLMTYTLNGGYDTDCNCATAGAIYGLIYGLNGIDKKWIDMADKEIITATKNLKHEIKTFEELTDATMRLIEHGIASGWNAVTKIVDKKPQLLSFVVPKRISKVDIDYPNGLELTLKNQLVANVVINNPTNDTITYTLDYTTPQSLIVEADIKKTIVLKGGEGKTISFTARLNRQLQVVPESNVILLKIASGASQDTYKIGFVGAQIFKLSPIFTDGFDYSGKEDIEKLSDDLVRVWGGKKFLYHTDCNEYTNNWLRFNHEYLSENWDKEHFDKCFSAFETYSTSEDFIKLDDIYQNKGPCVVYALQKLNRPKEDLIELHIGSSDPYKLWVNGELVVEQKKNWFFSPYNQRPRVKLKAGENQIVIKLARCGESQKFAYVLREHPFNHVGAISTDSEYSLV